MYLLNLIKLRTIVAHAGITECELSARACNNNDNNNNNNIVVISSRRLSTIPFQFVVSFVYARLTDERARSNVCLFGITFVTSELEVEIQLGSN